MPVRQLLNRPHLTWDTVHKYLEQMIFRYEDPTGIVTCSKNPIVREKVLFQELQNTSFVSATQDLSS